MTSQQPVLDLSSESTPVIAVLRDVWRSRRLLVMLARKDFFVRYRRAAFGLVWAVVLPLLQALVLALVLPRIVKFSTGVNYAVFVFSGILVWSFFSGSVTASATAIVDGADLSTKIYFPRALLPLVSVVSGLYGLVCGVAVFVGMALLAGAHLGPRLVLLLPALALLTLTSAAFGLVLSAIHVYFRDVRYLVQALLLPWFYITPVFYPLQVTKGAGRWLAINPATGLVELFRAATIGASPLWLTALWWCLGWTALLVIVALALHRRFNRVFVDLL